MELVTKASLSEEVTLSFAGLAVSFHCRSESVNVPCAFASRSKLLVDLRRQDDAADDVPVPLPFDSLKAWLAFLEERDGDQGSPADNRDCNLSDTALLQALEVSFAPKIVNLCLSACSLNSAALQPRHLKMVAALGGTASFKSSCALEHAYMVKIRCQRRTHV